MTLGLILPLATRQRWQLIPRTVRTTMKNMIRPDSRLMLCIDDDDVQMLSNLETWHEFDGDPRFSVSIGPREDTIAGKWNRALTAFPDARLYSPITDDSAILSPGFDEMALAAADVFPDGIGFVYNRLCNASFVSFQGMTKRVTELLGYIYPPLFPYWFVDHWIDDLARITDRISFTDIVVDQTVKPGTMEQRELGFWATFYDACRYERRREVQKIVAALEEAPWRKQVLLAHHPLVEQRSQWVNSNCRAMAQQMPDVQGGGERYDRIRAQAVGMLKGFVKEMEAEKANLDARQASYGQIHTPVPIAPDGGEPEKARGEPERVDS